MPSETDPEIEVRWWNGSTWVDITDHVETYMVEDSGTTEASEAEIRLYNPSGMYTDPLSAFYIAPYSFLVIKERVGTPWYIAFAGRVESHESTIEGMNPDYMPLVAKGPSQMELNDTITWAYSDEQETADPLVAWTFREMLQDFLGGYHSSGIPFLGIPDSGYDIGLVLEGQYNVNKLDARISQGCNFDKTPIMDSIHKVLEILQYDGFVTGILLSGRVCDHPFEWGSGTVSYDYSGKEHDGTFGGSTTAWAWQESGRPGGCVYFDGDMVNQDRINIPIHSDLQLTSVLTITARFRCIEKPSETQDHTIIDKSEGDYGIYINGLGRGADKGKIVVGGTDSGGTGHWFQSTNAYADANWHHVVWVKTATQIYLYIDGSLDPAFPQSETASFRTNSGDVVFGNNVPKNRPYYGFLDEIQIFNRALSSQEAAMLYAHERLRLRISPVGTQMALGAPVTYTHPYRKISMTLGPLADVFNYIIVTGGADSGWFKPDQLTENALAKFSPVVWTSDKPLADVGVGAPGPSTMKAGSNGLKVGNASTGMFSSYGSIASCYVELNIGSALTQTGSPVAYLDFSNRYGSINFWAWITDTGPTTGDLEFDIILYDNTSKKIRYRHRATMPLVNRVLYLNRPTGLSERSWQWVSVPLGASLETITAEDQARDNAWHYYGGSVSFDSTKVVTMRIDAFFRAYPLYVGGATGYFWLDGLEINSAALEIDPFKHPELFPDANSAGCYEDATSIAQYGVRVYPHTDNLITSFDQARDEGLRLLAMLKDPVRKVTIDKGAKVWLRPHDTVTVTAAEYGLSSTVMRVVKVRHEYEKGKYLKVIPEVVSRYSPTPPFSGGGKAQESASVPISP